LTDILVCELPELQINQQVALQDHVVENEVDVELLVFEDETLLACDERKPFPELKEEVRELAEDRRFEIAFVQGLAFRQVEEVEDDRRLDEIDRALDGLAFSSERKNAFLVATLRACSTAVASESRLGRSARSPCKRTFRTCAGTRAPNRRIDSRSRLSNMLLSSRR